MPWWIMAAHRAEGAPGRIAVVLELVRSITPRMFVCSTDTTPRQQLVPSRAARGRRGFELLMLVLTLPRLASIFTDCSVTDPYDCVARQGCGW